MFVEWVSFAIIAIAVVATGAGLGSIPRLRLIRNLLIAGALFRIVGVIARYTMIFDLYDGGSDAVGYFERGTVIAQHLRALDFSIFAADAGNREWGTQALRYISGIVLTFVGPSVRGSFLVFSSFAFIGLVCTVVAFGRANGTRSMRNAALLLFFWPTLWFWPSSMGKEAVLLLAVGIVTLGYVGRQERINWVLLAAGLALAMIIRPHLAGVLAVSVCVAEWTSREWSARRLTQAIVASAFSMWALIHALDLMGLGGADVDAFETFMLDAAGNTNQGGSAFERAGAVMAIPMSFLNILCRPFITEARSPMAIVSSLEMMTLWVLAIRNRRNLKASLQTWRTNRLMRFAVPFSLLYVLMIGMTFQNFGIIARQRTLVMPAVLIVIAAIPAARATFARTAYPQRRLWTPKASTASI
jgi:hypothetical protein